jgi:hypothetical protein
MDIILDSVHRDQPQIRAKIVNHEIHNNTGCLATAFVHLLAYAAHEPWPHGPLEGDGLAL